MNTVKNEVKKSANVQKVKAKELAKVTPIAKKDDVFEPMKKEVSKDVELKTKALMQNFRPTAEERIKNAEKFQILTKKYDHLKTKKEELEKFKISSDGTKERIYFENSEGYKLEVSNSNVVNAMLKLADNTLTEIVNETEKEVQEFVI